VPEREVKLKLPDLKLPDSLAREAEASGLLTPQALESMLRSEIRRRRVDRLFEAADRLASLGIPMLSPSELEAEIRAVREKNNNPNAGGS
jgi:hypothetical protein